MNNLAAMKNCPGGGGGGGGGEECNEGQISSRGITININFSITFVWSLTMLQKT